MRSWLEFQAEQEGLPPPMLRSWNWTGLDLIRLTEAQFRELIPHGGELLYAKLEIWREALRTSYQLEPRILSPHPPSTDSLHTAYHQKVTTHAPQTTLPQPLYVQVQPQTAPQYQHHVSQIYPSPSSSTFSPSEILMSPPGPSTLANPSPPPTSRQPQAVPRSPPPQATTSALMQAERQQQSCSEPPPKKLASPPPTAGQSHSGQRLPQQLCGPFGEKSLDVTTLLQQTAETSESRRQHVETPLETQESEGKQTVTLFLNYIGSLHKRFDLGSISTKPYSPFLNIQFAPPSTEFVVRTQFG